MPISLSGSLELTGSLTVTGGITMSGSIASASYALTATCASFAGNTVLFANRASSTFASTGSNNFDGTQTITGSLLQSGNYTTTGTITAQTINVQQVTSSIVYSCGSNNFGTAIGNTQVFTGSMFITGSNITANVSNACFSGVVCAPTVISTGQVCGIMANFSCVGIGTSSPTEKLVVVGNIYTNGTNTNLYLDNGGAGGASLKIGVIGTTETYINSLDADPLWFGTHNTERMRISSTGISCFACQVCAPASTIRGTINEQLVLDFVTGAGSYTHQSFRLCGTNQYRLIGDTNGSFILRNDIVSSNVLTFACAGTACFACSVNAVGLFSTTSASGNLASKIRNGVTSASGTTGYGLAIESEASAASSYALTVRNLAETTTYLHILTETGRVGNVGINTTTPNYKLEVNGTSCFAGNVTIGGTYCAFALNVHGVTYQIGGSTWVQNGYGYVNAGAVSTGLFPQSDCTIQLRIANSAALTINASNYVGIGTTEPAKPLEIRTGGSNTTPASIFNGAIVQAIVGGEPMIVFSSNISPSVGIPTASELTRAGIGFHYVSAALPSEFSIGIQCTNVCNSNVRLFNGVERIRITSAGAVAIRATCIGLSDIADRTLLLGSRPGNADIVSFGFDPGGTWKAGFDYKGSDGQLEWWTNNGSWCRRIMYTPTGVACFSNTVCAPIAVFSGCVGIGQTSPAFGLEVFSTSQVAITSDNTFASHLNIIFNRDNVGGTRNCFNLLADQSSAYIRTLNDYPINFITNNQNRFLISNTGAACFACQVCLATQLVVKGGSNNIFPWSDALDGQPGMFAVSCLGSSYFGLYAKMYGPSVNAGIFGINSQCVAFIGTEGACNKGLIIGTINSAPIYIGTSNSNRLIIASSGEATFSCQVCAPAGVKFGNGSSTLNYYEQGTWTPRLKNGSFTTNVGGPNAGWYIRVGNIVTVGGTLSWTDGSGAQDGNSLQIACLPFASNNATDFRSVGQFGAPSPSSIGFKNACAQMTLIVDPGASFIYIIENYQSGTYLTYSHSPCANTSGTIYGFQATYITG